MFYIPQCLQMLPNLCRQGKPFKMNSAHIYLSLPSCPVLLGSMRIRAKVKLLLHPRNLQWILRRLPKNKSKNMKLFGSGKSFLWTVRTKKEIIFLVSNLCVWENVLRIFSGVLLGTQSCSSSNAKYLKLQIVASVISEPIIFFKFISNHFIASLKLQWPSIVYRKGRGKRD